jgi:hypothetical protein
MRFLPRCYALIAAGLLAAPGQAQEAGSVLRELELRLKPVLAGLNPPPTFRYVEPGRSLEVSYRAQKFVVHPQVQTGQWSTNVIERVGPSAAGFILTAHLQPLGTVNESVTPQTLREPYWSTYLQVTTVAGTTNQIYWGLSSSAWTDERLVARLMRTIESLALSGPAPATKPPGRKSRGASAAPKPAQKAAPAGARR